MRGAVLLGFLASAGVADAALFERLTPEASGVGFRYTWNPPEKYDHEMVNAVTGGGACAGDYDGDGLADLFLTQPFGGCRLYRNLGGWKFEDVTKSAGLAETGQWGTGASFADVDNDGDLDLFVCGYDCTNRFYLNSGDGRFVEVAAKAGLAYSGASVMMAFADYDRDGDLDGFLLTNHIAPKVAPRWDYEVRERDGMPILPESLKGEARVLYRPDLRQGRLIPAGERDRLFRNDGAGADGVPVFVDVTDEAGVGGEYFGLGATWWDYNGDGWPDVSVSNDFWGPDHLWRNNGDGTFTDVALVSLPHTPWFSMGSDVCDLNNDGLLDFMASDMSATTHYKSKLSMGDMQGWFLELSRPRQYMRNAVYVNTGKERFQEVAHLLGVASTDWTWSLKFGDLDGDGWEDLYVTNGAERFWDNSDLMSEARGAQRIDTPELKAVWLPQPKRDDPNLVYRNTGELGFQEVGEAWGLGEREVSYGAAYADFDNDGDLDLAVNHFDGAAGLYRNGAVEGGAKMLSVRLKGGESNRDGVGAIVRAKVGELEMTRYHTLARGFMSANDPRLVHFGTGGAEVVDALEVRWPSGKVQVVEGVEAGGGVVIEEEGESREEEPEEALLALSAMIAKGGRAEVVFDDFARQPLLPNKLSQLGPGIAFADVNGDGWDDFYIGRSKGNAGLIHLHSGKVKPTGESDFVVRATAPFDKDTEKEEMGVVFFDADGDADQDLYVVSGGVECEPGDAVLRDGLYLNAGLGAFVRAPEGALPDVRDSGGCVAAVDFDRDGDVDLFVGGRAVPGQYPVGARSRLLVNDGKGVFADGTPECLGEEAMVTAALWSDVDGDGWSDLLVASEWGEMRVHRNVEGRLAAGVTIGGRGWWNSITGGDLDGDGDIDYVVGNWGENTKYHASKKKPVRIYYGDFDGSGKRRIVEAKVGEEALLPVRGKSCSQNAMPALREKFPTFDSFARATLEEIYSPVKLGEAFALEASELRSGILWNESEAGEVRLRFEPLPVEAQVAPLFGAAVVDIDLDGVNDIVAAGNFFGPQVETGRANGGVGVVLRGLGGGKFEAMRADRSGFLVPGDGMGLAVVDLNHDARPDLVVAQNNGPLLTFLNRVPGGEGEVLAVRLDGARGPGARVEAVMADGRVRVAEIYGGSGYLSQSVPEVTFAGGVVKEVRVRWADGEVSRSEVGAGSRRVLVK